MSISSITSTVSGAGARSSPNPYMSCRTARKNIQSHSCQKTKIDLHSLSNSFFFLLDDLKEPRDSR